MDRFTPSPNNPITPAPDNLPAAKPDGTTGAREDNWNDPNPADEPEVGGDPQGLPQQGTDKATVHLDPVLAARADREGKGYRATEDGKA